MKAIILVGGRGTRLRPITYEIPKPLIPVKKRPILNHTLGLLLKHGITEIALLANTANAEDFRRWWLAWKDDFPGVQIITFYEEEPRGTFGGFHLVRQWVGNDTFIVSNGDDLKDFDISRMLLFHEKKGGDLTMALMKVPDPYNFGVPFLSGDRVIKFLEKPTNPPSNFVSGGLYVMEPTIFDVLDSSRSEMMIEQDLLPELCKKGTIYGFCDERARCFDCGTLERWEKAMREW